MKTIWKFILVIFLFLALLGYAGFYLYNYNKKNGLAPTNPENQIPPITVNQKEEKQIPIYLTVAFWKSVTDQELENQLKTITDVNEIRLDNKRSMLHLLVRHGNHPEMVKILIDAGVDYNLKDEVTTEAGEIDNRKALFYAIIRDDQAYEFSQALLEYTDDPNSYINNKVTPLILASYYRQYKIVEALLKKGANPNIRSSTQSTPLIATSTKNVFTNNSYIDPNTIQLLLDHNADITAKNKKGKNAFDYMKENEEFTKTELFKKLSEQFPQ